MTYRLLIALFSLSSALVAQNFAVLQWNGEFAKSSNYSLEKGTVNESVESFQFNHLENEASTEFRHFKAYISNGEYQQEKLEIKDTLLRACQGPISLYYVKESYYIEQQFSFIEDDEMEVVGDDFFNAKPDSEDDGEPKKVLLENYYWVGRNPNLNGKQLDIVVERNTEDEAMLKVEQEFLMDFLTKSRFSNFDAFNYYSGINAPTEKSVFGLTKKAFEAYALNDTSVLFNRVANAKDYVYFFKKLDDQAGQNISETISDSVDYNNSYLGFRSINNLTSISDLEKLKYSFHVEKGKTGSYYSYLKVSLENEVSMNLMASMYMSKRGLVLMSLPKVSIETANDISTNSTPNILKTISNSEEYVNSPFYKYLNANVSKIRSWEVQDKHVVLHVDNGELKVKLKGGVKSGKIEDLERLKIKSIEHIQQVQSKGALVPKS